MKRRTMVAGVATLVTLALPLQALAAGTGSLPLNLASLLPVPVCSRAPIGAATCQAQVLSVPLAGGGTTPFASLGPAGYGPKDFQSAYALASAAATGGFGQTVAVVDAYDDPTAAADLTTYRSQYGLPACPSGSCFTKVNQTGGTNFSMGANASWNLEESLDLDTLSAVCPNCHILLVEANSEQVGDLMAAENEAMALGATEVSNSWGSNEFNTETGLADDGIFSAHPHVPVTAATGDSAADVYWPATAPQVTAVGGTTLTKASNSRGWSESPWSSAGSGCSQFEGKPTWQLTVSTGCSMRDVGDVSADADPNSGAAIYQSFGYNGTTGWMVVGGTSLATPIIAAVYALAGNATSMNGASYAYGHTASLNAVSSSGSGSGGLLGGLGALGGLGGLFGGGATGCILFCSTSPSSWNGKVGLGTPKGTGAF